MAHNNPLRQDPTRTITLRKQFIAEMNKRFRVLRGEIFNLVLTLDVFGLTDNRDPSILGASLFNSSGLVSNQTFQEWRFETDARKLDLFNNWFQERIDAGVLIVGPNNAEPWTNEFVESAYRKGVVRAYTDTHVELLADDLNFFEGTKAEFLRQAFGAPEAVSKLRLLQTRSFETLKGVTQSMGSQMNIILADGLANGLHPRVIAREMNRRIEGITKARARTIARTEIVHAHAEGQLDSFERIGVDEIGAIAEFSTAGDDRVCVRCQELEGRTFTVKEARGIIPIHPNCVLGDTTIISPDCNTLIKGHYSGEIIKLLTKKGFKVSVTPNHILTTEFGFLPAKLIYKGLNLFVNTFADYGIDAPNNYGDIPLISEVFETFWKSFGMFSGTMPVTSKNLHNEGSSFNGEINIININSILRNACDTHIVETFSKHFFPLANTGTTSLNTLGTCSQVFGSMAHSFDSSMGVFRDCLSFFLGHLLHAKKHGFASVSSSDISILQSFVNNVSTDFEFLSECVNTHAVFKQFDDSSRRAIVDVLTSDTDSFDTSFFQSMFYGITLDPIKLSDFVEADILDGMHPDSVIDIEVSHVDNIPVYDLETKSTMYFANGILSSNCRCAWIPLIPRLARK